MLEITPSLDESLKTSLYIQLYDYLKNEIKERKIPAETRLPSIRKLSMYLNISRNTVEKAYHQLISEGYVESRPRSGLYVMELEKEVSVPLKPKPVLSSKKKQKKPTIKYDFRFGNIDVNHFPFSTWRKLTNRCLHSDQKELFSYGHHQGEYELRKQIKKYLYYSRGVVCVPEQVIIGAGIQQSLSLLSQIMKLYNQTVAVEDPGYDGAKSLFRNHGCTIDSVPLDDDGIDIQNLYQSQAKVVYVTPSHQFPFGMIMPYNKRIQLLQWAEEKHGLIIEDDYDSEFRYTGKPIPSLQGLDKNNKVIYLGTFSKSLIPSLRISYMVLPTFLIDIYKRDFKAYQQPVSRIHQKTLQLFMKDGFWDRHIRKMRTTYHKKQHTLISIIKEQLKDKVEIIGNGAGLHILLKVYTNMTESELIHQAEKNKVKVYPTSKFWTHQPSKEEWPVIQIGFGGLSEEEIINGIIILEKSWFNN